MTAYRMHFLFEMIYFHWCTIDTIDLFDQVNEELQDYFLWTMLNSHFDTLVY